MMKNPLLIIYIRQGQLQFFGHMVNKISPLDLPVGSVVDMDIVQKDGFYTAVRAFAQKHTLEPCDVCLVLHPSVYLTQIVTTSNETQSNQEIQQFFEAVPFDVIGSRVYPISQGKLIVAMNKQYYETIIHALQQHGLRVTTVVPQGIMGAMQDKQGLDEVLTKYIQDNSETLRKQTLPLPEDAFKTIVEADYFHLTTKQREIALVGVFVFLILILLIMVVTQTSIL